MCRLGIYMAGVPVRLESRGSRIKPDRSHVHMVDRPLSFLSLRGVTVSAGDYNSGPRFNVLTSKLESRSLNRDVGV